MSSDLLAKMSDDCTLNILNRIESNHMPVALSIKFSKDNIIADDPCESNATTEKYSWKDEFANSFKLSLLSAESHTLFNHAIEMIDIDIHIALDIFNECIKNAAVCMRKTVRVNGRSKQQDWYDGECRMGKRLVRRLLRRYRRTRSDVDRIDFCKSRREYKNLLFRKRKMFNAMMINKLITSINTQQDFWNAVKSIIQKRTCTKNDITITQWFRHFQRLRQKEVDNEEMCDVEDVTDTDNEHVFNRPISEEAVSYTHLTLPTIA